MFDKILIANRGEIACRVMRTARRLGVKTVAVYSDADAKSQHVLQADEAYFIGQSVSSQSYLRGDVILEKALQSGAQAIHPGYGFLSENATFAEQCHANGVTFIGPPPEAMRSMASKSQAKAIMTAAGVPVTPGYFGELQDLATLKHEAEKIGYPVMLKAVHGGGGKGMRIVTSAEDFEEKLASCKREAKASFGYDRVLVEKFLVEPRHIEFQIFGDTLGDAVHLFERDCSVQRRHQKVLEESPAPFLSTEMRNRMGAAAVAAAKAVGYVGAGTVEFMLSKKGDSFYFMEMNTRLQVEHPVTEMVTKQDLVEWQLRVASGFPLPLRQDQISQTGHAIEARIYAENPHNGFLPGSGKLVHLREPQAEANVRVETGVVEGDEVSIFYDPMIAKLVLWEPDRAAALKKLRKWLESYEVAGLATNIEFVRRCLGHPVFMQGGVSTHFIQDHESDLIPVIKPLHPLALSVATLAQVLLETGRAGAGLDEKSSPWAAKDSFRVTGPLQKVFRFSDCGKDVAVPVQFNADGSYSIHAGGQVLHAEGMIAADGMITATVDGFKLKARAVMHKETLNLFSNNLGDACHYQIKPILADYGNAGVDSGSQVITPMPGKVVKVLATAGMRVKKGDAILIMEAMKMEHIIRAPRDCEVESTFFKELDFVGDGKVLVKFKNSE